MILAMWVRALVWGLAWSGAVACSGAVVDPEGSTDGAAGDSGQDVDTGVSPTADAAADAGVVADSGGMEDAGSVVMQGCAGHTYKLCEDFESPGGDGMPAGWRRVFPYWPDPSSAKPQEVFVANDRAHWGTRALKSTSDACAQTRAEHDLVALGATAGRHWGRVFFAVNTPAPQSDPNGSGWYHTTLVALRGDNSGGGNANECRVVDMVESAFDQSVSFLYNVPDDSCCQSTEVTPYDFEYESVWHCAEWFVDASTDSYRFFLDGTELLSFTGQAGSNLDACDRSLSVGAVCYAPPRNAPQNLTTWIDDVALDDDRIGCN